MSIKKTKRKRYFTSLSDRALSYLYPIFLLALEWFLRLAFQLNTQEFVGPTLAATSVGLVIPLIAFRSAKGLSDENGNKLPPEILEQLRRLEESGAKLVSGESVIFANLCFLMSLLFTLAWVATISYLLGVFCFVLGLFLSEMKEFL
jgi:hypothetical protein